MILGLDGSQKMSKSRANAIDIKMTICKETAIKRAKTDSDRRITYDEVNRPEVANLLRLLCVRTKRPNQWAEDSLAWSSGMLKHELTEHLNSFLFQYEIDDFNYAQQTAVLEDVIGEGNKRARTVARETLREVTEVQ